MTTTTSFWENAADSLPPEARRRYATDFEAAERFEVLLDLGIEACGIATRAFAKGCRRRWNADPSHAGDTGTI